MPRSIDRTRMLLRGAVTAVASFCLLCAAATAEPPYPIPAEDAERLAELERLQEAEPDIDRRLAAAAEAISIRKRHQPDDWWEVGDARRLAARLRTERTLDAEQLASWQAALQRFEEAKAGGSYDALIEAGKANIDALIEAGKANIAINDRLFPQHGELNAAVLAEIGGSAMVAGRHKDAEAYLAKGLAGFQRVLEKNHLQLGITTSSLGLTKSLAGRHAEGEADTRRAIALMSSVLDADDLRLLQARFGLAMIHIHKRELGKAEAILHDLLARFKAGVPDPPGLRLSVLNQLADSRTIRGANAEVVEIRRELVSAHTEHYGPDHILTLMHRSALAVDTGNFGGDELMREVVEDTRRVFGENHFRTLEMRARYAFTLQMAKRPADAVREYREIFESGFDRYKDGRLYELVVAKANYSKALLALDRVDEAETALLEDLEAMDRTFGRNHALTSEALRSMLPIHLTKGRFGQAARLARRLLRSPATHGLLAASVRSQLAIALYLMDDLEGAEAELRTVVTMTESQHASDDGLFRSVYFDRKRERLLLASILAGRGKPQEAFEILESALARGLLDDILLGQERARVASASPRSLAEIQSLIPADAALLVRADV